MFYFFGSLYKQAFSFTSYHLPMLSIPLSVIRSLVISFFCLSLLHNFLSLSVFNNYTPAFYPDTSQLFSFLPFLFSYKSLSFLLLSYLNTFILHLHFNFHSSNKFLQLVPSPFCLFLLLPFHISLSLSASPPFLLSSSPYFLHVISSRNSLSSFRYNFSHVQ